MADKKISALTGATTPLDGTEVLPIVQSGTTVKVANNDLRPKQLQSNATSGVLQIVGPAAASTWVMTTPNANFTAARTDAAQSFTGDQTLSTGNLIQGTAAKGFNFTANIPASGMTSQLLNWCEEGTWTPAYEPATNSFTSISYGFRSGKYFRIGNMVYVTWRMRTSALTVGTASGAVNITGLPFTNSATQLYFALGIGVDFAVNDPGTGLIDANTSVIQLQQQRNNTAVVVTDLSTGSANNFTAGFACYTV